MIKESNVVICIICGTKRVVKNMIIIVDSEISQLRIYECNTTIKPHNLTTKNKSKSNY